MNSFEKLCAIWDKKPTKERFSIVKQILWGSMSDYDIEHANYDSIADNAKEIANTLFDQIAYKSPRIAIAILRRIE